MMKRQSPFFLKPLLCLLLGIVVIHPLLSQDNCVCLPPVLSGNALVNLPCNPSDNNEDGLPDILSELVNEITINNPDELMLSEIMIEDSPVLIDGCKRSITRTYRLRSTCSTPLRGCLEIFIWSEFDNNGIQDIGRGEQGIEGFGLELVNEAGNSIEGISNSNGIIFFDNLPYGEYCFQVPLFLSNSRYLVSPNQGNNDALDSDPDSNGQVCFTIEDTDCRTDIDVGYLQAI